MRVTIICDASHCPQFHVAGYGYWIASDRGRKGGGGQILSDVFDNNTAEMMAICNTIWHGINTGLIQEGDQVLIQTDCLAAIDRLGEKLSSTRPQDLQALRYFREVTFGKSLQISWRHVKGHTNLQDARYAANRACDKRAKVAMRAARKKKVLEKARKELEQ